jgi:hypothetical protein
VKRLFIFLVSGIAILTLIVGVVAWLSLQPQSWYDPPDFNEPEIASLADLAERRMNEEFHKVRPVDEVWHLRITEDAVNAWLSGRLEGWLTHDQQIEMPKEVHDPQIHITKEGVWLAANIEVEGNTPRPLAIELWIWIEDGTMFAEPISVRLGRMPVPLSIFESVMTELKEEMRGIDAITPLMDDREVHIHEIELEESAFVLTCQTHLP